MTTRFYSVLMSLAAVAALGAAQGNVGTRVADGLPFPGCRDGECVASEASQGVRHVADGLPFPGCRDGECVVGGEGASAYRIA